MSNVHIDAASAALAHLGDSDPLVAGTFYLLLVLSLTSWGLIVYKALQLWQASRANRAYSAQFWASPNALNYLMTPTPSHVAAPLAHLSAHGVEALRHFQAHGQGTGGMGPLGDTLTRALRQSIQNQLTHYEAGLGVLATIGNTAPFIGLFGTVVGMMTTLQRITASGTTDLSVVAGPIGEALLATAAGIACAVPAVVAYNSFVRRLKVFTNVLDSFAYDLLAHLSSSAAVARRAGEDK